MEFVELTMLTRDDQNGSKIHVRVDQIFAITPVKDFRVDSVHLIGQTVTYEGSFIWFLNGSKQTYRETVEEVFAKLRKPIDTDDERNKEYLQKYAGVPA